MVQLTRYSVTSSFMIKLMLAFHLPFSYLCQTAKMKLFAKIVEGWKPLAILSKSCIFDVWQGSEHASGNLTLRNNASNFLTKFPLFLYVAYLIKRRREDFGLQNSLIWVSQFSFWLYLSHAYMRYILRDIALESFFIC